MSSRARWLTLLTVLWVFPAIARVGGGEHYTSDNSDPSSDGGLGGLMDFVFFAIRYPAIGVPLLLIFIGYAVYVRRQNGNGSTRKAIDRIEEQHRTSVSAAEAHGWVGKLKASDPQFDLLGLFDKARKLFIDLQQSWFRRDLIPVRAFLSDANFQRLSTQLKLVEAQGIRDALADVQLLDLQIIGLEQSQWFDTVHIRVKASLRDTEVPKAFSDDQARLAAQQVSPELFVEVWSFVRKPGVQTQVGADLYQGHCPNCGAPFNGGASNACDSCQAIVNSGNYDWVLAEITQGMEFVRNDAGVEGIAKARQTDPALNTEMLEDRASLCFWRWVEAQSLSNPSALAKVATVQFKTQVGSDIEALAAKRCHHVFLECAVGAVQTRTIELRGDLQLAQIEVRWSARHSICPIDEMPAPLPSLPQRWVFTLSRKAGAQTHTQNGMATARCPKCNAPSSDNGSSRCEFCDTDLATGEHDWVLSDAVPWEAWQRVPSGRRVAIQGIDRSERERLLFMMASMAAADGVVHPKERELLKMCSERWAVPWANVELALTTHPRLFDRLLKKQAPEAENFLQELVNLALIDGKVDRNEKRLLEAAAGHLGLSHRLSQLLK